MAQKANLLTYFHLAENIAVLETTQDVQVVNVTLVGITLERFKP